ncbi:MAG TPA: hypothetical protein VGB30_11050 [bacterium]|jgi:hypothetical protein
MKIDTYTKFILTALTIGVWALAISFFVRPMPLLASGEAMDVKIVDISSSIYEPLPIEIREIYGSLSNSIPVEIEDVDSGIYNEIPVRVRD